jgi:small subunit ribosomal protein S6e
LADYRAVVNDPKNGKSYNRTIGGHYASALVGKKVGDEIDGIFIGLPGYKLVIAGGSDKDGFPMRPDLPGPRRKPILVTGGVGFRPRKKGLRRRKTLRGNTVGPDTLQINLKITAYGPKSIEDAFKEQPAAKK